MYMYIYICICISVYSAGNNLYNMGALLLRFQAARAREAFAALR